MKVSKLLAAMMCCGIATVALGQNEKPKMPEMPKVKLPEMKKDAQAAGEKKDGMGQPDGDEMAWMKAMTPGDMHTWIAKGAGNWDATVKMMEPGQPVTEGKATMTVEMILGGRFSHSLFKGEFMGMPFEGAGTMGYNNVTKKFESTWMDNMTTGTTYMSGTVDAAGKVLTLTGDMADPSTGKVIKQREVFTMKGDNESLMEFYHADKDGKEAKIMEIAYTRSKGGEKDKGMADKARDEMDKAKKKMQEAMPKK